MARVERFFWSGLALLGLVLPARGAQELEDVGYPATLDVPRVLFLTHSAGYVHDVVRRPDPAALSIAESALSAAASGQFELVCTQDCAALEPASLARYEAVVFYTTGELPLSPAALRGLEEWIRGGGGFAGIHCATDTLYEVPWYGEMLGGRFDGHPWSREVEVRVEDARHPAVAHLGRSFRIADEIYQFRDFRRHPARVLLALEPGSVDVALGKRADGDYALAWTRDWGEGRVFYTALGHGESVWGDERFLRHVLAGIRWTLEGPELPCAAPSGATVLVGSRTTGEGPSELWRQRDGSACAWSVGAAVSETEPATLEVAPGAGDLVTREAFGDALIHVEFRVPTPAGADSEARGNSGVYLQGRYELQVLDSHGSGPVGAGECGALYGRRAPDLNACRPGGRWQTFDVEFRAPRFDAAGAKTASARVSVWLNGIPIHADVELGGTTGGALADTEAARGPLLLQDHGERVRYRNVWVLPR